MRLKSAYLCTPAALRRYHLECIDQWLSHRRAVCPICKCASSVLRMIPTCTSREEEKDVHYTFSYSFNPTCLHVRTPKLRWLHALRGVSAQHTCDVNRH